MLKATIFRDILWIKYNKNTINIWITEKELKTLYSELLWKEYNEKIDLDSDFIIDKWEIFVSLDKIYETIKQEKLKLLEKNLK